MVSDVISEMEREFGQQQTAQPHVHQHANPNGPPSLSNAYAAGSQQASMMYATHAPHPGIVPYQPSAFASISGISKFIDKKAAQRALVAALIAFALFYPEDMSALYAKVPLLNRFSGHDRIIRTLLLAVVLYLVFWKVDM